MKKTKPCPGSKIKSSGKGRGLGTGQGRGPIGQRSTKDFKGRGRQMAS